MWLRSLKVMALACGLVLALKGWAGKTAFLEGENSAAEKETARNSGYHSLLQLEQNKTKACWKRKKAANEEKKTDKKNKSAKDLPLPPPMPPVPPEPTIDAQSAKDLPLPPPEPRVESKTAKDLPLPPPNQGASTTKAPEDLNDLPLPPPMEETTQAGN
ncbi:MAG: hypothetical protein WC371_01165 [Parachlamydiales bacterium]|jgi:hypothetical protein